MTDWLDIDHVKASAQAGRSHTPGASTSRPLRTFITAPYALGDQVSFWGQLMRVCGWAEDAGFTGILIFTDSRLHEWTTAQVVLSTTSALTPIVALQPAFTHPYDAAKAIASLAAVYPRPIYLNAVAGSSLHLTTIGDHAEHDARYARLKEYVEVVRGLLSGDFVTYQGDHYDLSGAILPGGIPDQLSPHWYMAGSSAVCAATAAELGADRLCYPMPLHDDRLPTTLGQGIRLGLLGRETSEQAWKVAHARFPGDAVGEERFEWYVERTDSSWSVELGRTPSENGTYWLYPFHTFRTFCPYLVGDHQQVAGYLAEYLKQGVSTLILDTPAGPQDLAHAEQSIRLACEIADVSYAEIS